MKTKILLTASAIFLCCSCTVHQHAPRPHRHPHRHHHHHLAEAMQERPALQACAFWNALQEAPTCRAL